MSVQTFAGSFSADAVTYIAKKTLMIAKKNVIFQQLADKAELPAGNSKTFQYTRYDRLPLPQSSLTEGVTPDNTVMSISTVQAVADQWGAFVNLSDVAVLTVSHPIMVKAIDLMGYQAAETVDREIINVLLAGTSVNYPGTITARGSLSSTTTDIMSSALVRKVVKILRVNGAYEFDGQKFMGVVDPAVEADLMADSTFVTAASYSNIKVLWNGEIGEWLGAKWMRSNFIPSLTGVAAPAYTQSTGGAIADASYYLQYVAVDASTGFQVKASQEQTLAVSAGSSTASIIGTAPATTGYYYNVYAGAATGVRYLSQSLLSPSAAFTITAIPVSGSLGPVPPGTSKEVHFSWLFGKEAFSSIDLQKLQTYVTPNAASDSDPLAQRRKAGWKLMFKAVICNQNFIQRIESLSAY